MADPNIKTTANGLIYYPIENVDPWWYIIDQTGVGTFDSIEQRLIAVHENASAVLYADGSFVFVEVSPGNCELQWDSDVHVYVGSAVLTQTGPGSLSVADGQWVYAFIPGGSRPAGSITANPLFQAGVLRNDPAGIVPIGKRVGVSFLRLLPSN